MAIFNITSTEADWIVNKEDSSTDCSTAFTYTIIAQQGDLIDMSLSDSFNNGRYYLNGVEASLGSTVVQVSFNNTLEIKFFIGNSGSAGVFLDTLVTIVNGSDTYADTAVRYNDSAACGSDVGCYDCPPLPGPTGPQGSQGLQGDQGLQGIQGIDGAQGLQGIDGIQGIQGDAGIQGIDGDDGDTGTQGIQGVQGTQGNVGSTGTGITFMGSVADQASLPGTGTQGDAYINQTDDSLWIHNGTTFIDGGPIGGPQGIQGVQGIQGIQGLQGIDGDTGLTGSTGPAGAQGIQGIQGETGLDGAAGTSGIQGIQGIQGVQGEQGLTGATGADSTVAGPTGPQGIPGDNGATGPTGPTGADSTVVGPQGPIGNTGPQGSAGADSVVAGPQGIQGETGDTGLTGDTGATGADSNVPGPPGPEGSTGPNGTNGTNGTNGNAGPTGPAGPSAVSTDADNTAVLGTDSLIYVPEGVAGSGTDNFIVKWDGTDSLQNSVIYGDDTNVGINETSPTERLHVDGDVRVTGAYHDSGNSTGSSGQILSSTSTGTDWVDPTEGGTITVSVFIGSSQAKDLVANPIAIAANPGSQQVIRVINATVRIIHGQPPPLGIAFDYTNPLMIEYTDGEDVLELPVTQANVAAGTPFTDVYYRMKQPTVGTVNLELPVNLGLQFSTATTDATVGSGSIVVAVTYSIHNLTISM